MEEKWNDYLSDEELEKLISDVEQHHMMQAPGYLKNEIMNTAKLQIEQVEPILESQTRVTQMPQNTSKNKVLDLQERRRSLFLYGMKVAAAAVAAIVILFTIPVQQSQQVVVPKENKTITNQISQQSNDFCSRIFEATNHVVSGEIFKNNDQQ